MKILLSLASLAEAATGLALLITPQLTVRLLSGDEIADEGIAVSRIAGIALTALGVSCWPRGKYVADALLSMLVYGVLVTPYHIGPGISEEWKGILLWPAVAGHGMLLALLILAWIRSRPGVVNNTFGGSNNE